MTRITPTPANRPYLGRKRLLLKCSACPESRLFTGDSVGEITAAIDRSGWHDLPDENGGIAALCPKCDAKAS